jgi:butyrate kinase
MSHKDCILVVNTGSMTTKCSIHDVSGETLQTVWNHTVEHPDDLIHRFPTIGDQIDEREAQVKQQLPTDLLRERKLLAIGAIGGMLPPVPSGTIAVNEKLEIYSLKTPVYQHASNLGAPIAARLGRAYGVDAYVVDPVGVDEMAPIARISGSPEFPRFSYVHALNIRATVRKLAAQLGKPFAAMRCVVAHLGGGFSIAPFDRGRIVDSDNRMEGAPFTPERAGGIPPIPLLEAAFSGTYTKKELHKKLYGAGGVFAYLGTKDIREVARRIEAGDDYAKFIFDAMIYQIAKEIGAMGSVLEFDLDGIIITGGIAHQTYLVEELTRKTRRIANVYVFPGGNENEAIAESTLLAISGREPCLQWPDCILPEEQTNPLLKWRPAPR